MEETSVVLSGIPSGWIAKPEAIALSKRSLKGFEQTIAANKIETQYITNPGKRPLPIYRLADIEKIVKVEALVVAGAKGLTKPTKRTMVVPPEEAIAVDRMHLVTQGQAHKLGYPIPILRAWRESPNPPGIAYGKSGFRYSIPALIDRMKYEIRLVQEKRIHEQRLG